MTTPHTRHLVQKLVETDEKVKVLVHELYVVTGASRGIGRAVALALAKKHVNLDFLLIARSENALEAIKKDITPHLSKDTFVATASIDLSEESLVEEKLNAALSKLDASRYLKATLINNAGDTAGDQQKPLRELSSLATIQKHFCLNIGSYIYLTAAFLRKFSEVEKLVVVNISSSAARVPYECWSLYCANRAARRIVLGVLAKEEDANKVKVLNYEPGVVQTGLQDDIQKQMTPCSTHTLLKQVLDNGKAVPVETAADDLVSILEENRWENGGDEQIYERRPTLNPFGQP